jgi:hypothetical protein
MGLIALSARIAPVHRVVTDVRVRLPGRLQRRIHAQQRARPRLIPPGPQVLGIGRAILQLTRIAERGWRSAALRVAIEVVVLETEDAAAVVERLPHASLAVRATPSA